MSSENIGGIEQGRLIPGHVYELDNGELGHFFGPGHANNRWPNSLPKPLRDLTISRITEADVGRWAKTRDGDSVQIVCLNGCKTYPITATWMPFFRRSSIFTTDGRYGVQPVDDDLVAWLSRSECRERGLDAQHETQRYDIEPAREGAAVSGATKEPQPSAPGCQSEAPPARQPSDYDVLAEFFKDRRPDAVPFALGQRAAVEAKRFEACPACNGRTRLTWRGTTLINCVECDGRGTQEVR